MFKSNSGAGLVSITTRYMNWYIIRNNASITLNCKYWYLWYLNTKQGTSLIVLVSYALDYLVNVLTATPIPKKISASPSTSNSGDSEGGNVAGGEAPSAEWAAPLNSTGSVCTMGNMVTDHTKFPHWHRYQNENIQGRTPNTIYICIQTHTALRHARCDAIFFKQIFSISC